MSADVGRIPREPLGRGKARLSQSHRTEAWSARSADLSGGTLVGAEGLVPADEISLGNPNFFLRIGDGTADSLRLGSQLIYPAP